MVNSTAPSPAAADERDDDDAAVMERIARRDPSALAALYDRHAGLVYSLCQKILRDPPAAEEVLLDVFYELWEKSARFDRARGSVVTYLVTLARSRALDRLRSRASARAHVHGNTESTPPPAADVAHDPLRQALGAERRRQVAAALDQLDEGPRSAIELAYFQGLSHTDIAARMDRPLGTVKTWIRQGLIRLRHSLRSADEDAL